MQKTILNTLSNQSKREKREKQSVKEVKKNSKDTIPSPPKIKKTDVHKLMPMGIRIADSVIKGIEPENLNKLFILSQDGYSGDWPTLVKSRVRKRDLNSTLEILNKPDTNITFRLCMRQGIFPKLLNRRCKGLLVKQGESIPFEESSIGTSIDTIIKSIKDGTLIFLDVNAQPHLML